MVPTLMQGPVTLRKIQESDIEDRLRIGSHHEFVHMCGGESLPAPEYPSRKAWEEWYETTRKAGFTWIIQVDSKCVGSAGFHQIRPEDNCAVYRIGIFDPAYHSKGIGSIATKLLLGYGFHVMKWHRIELRVLDYNHRAIRCYEKCGFRKDGLLRENALIDGVYYSDMVMSILDYEFQKLEETI